jgi:transposase InsO family protein
MPLTFVAIRNAKPCDKPYKVGDTLGLFQLVQPSGGKLWRVKYRIDGKEKTLAIGIYPQVGLAEARRRRDAARELVAAGKDPGREKQREKVRSRIQAKTTFDAIAAEFCQKRRSDGHKAWAVSTATREALAIDVDQGIKGEQVVEAMDRIASICGVPRAIRVDNGPEFIAMALDRWAYENGVAPDFSRLGKPTDNAFVGSFNGRFRDECLNTHWFLSLANARSKIDAWRRDYNECRPHTSLGWLTPAKFASSAGVNPGR